MRISVFPKGDLEALAVQRTMTIFDWIDKATALPVDGLELYSGMFWTTDDAHLDAVGDALDAAGFEMPMLCASPDLTHPDPSVRSAEFDREVEMIRVASRLGRRGSSTRVLSGQRHPGVEVEQGIEWVIDAIERLIPIARELGVTLAMENHYKDGPWAYPEFAQRSEVFLAIVNAVDDRATFGVQFDPSNAIVAGDDSAEFLTRVIDRVVTMQASDRSLAPGASLDDLRQSDGTIGYSPLLQHGVIGQGMNDYPLIFRTLADAGYDGWISIEDGVNGMDEMAQSVDFLIEGTRPLLRRIDGGAGEDSRGGSEVRGDAEHRSAGEGGECAMKALVKYGMSDGDVEVRDVPEPELQPGTVLVAARAVGVCGSDIHMWRNGQSWDVAVPVTLGHETAGVIAAVADDVTGWAVGDRVVCETAASICGVCALCRTGRYNLCPHRQGYGATRDGAFGELMLAEPRVLHRIPDDVTFEQAAMTEPFAVAYNALVERATVTPGDLVVIQGAGAIGALALLIARLRGAGTTVVLGTPVDEHRLAMLRELGADHAVDITKADPGALVRTLGDGLGADVVVDATGVSAALEQGLDLVRPFGSIAKVGVGAAAARIQPRPARREGRDAVRLLLAHVDDLGARSGAVLDRPDRHLSRARRRLRARGLAGGVRAHGVRTEHQVRHGHARLTLLSRTDAVSAASPGASA